MSTVGGRQQKNHPEGCVKKVSLHEDLTSCIVVERYILDKRLNLQGDPICKEFKTFTSTVCTDNPYDTSCENCAGPKYFG
jgi:hypothetical protein